MTWLPPPPARGVMRFACSNRKAPSWKVGTACVLCDQQCSISPHDPVQVPRSGPTEQKLERKGSNSSAVHTSLRASSFCHVEGAVATWTLPGTGAADWLLEAGAEPGVWVGAKEGACTPAACRGGQQNPEHSTLVSQRRQACTVIFWPDAYKSDGSNRVYCLRKSI